MLHPELRAPRAQLWAWVAPDKVCTETGTQIRRQKLFCIAEIGRASQSPSPGIVQRSVEGSQAVEQRQHGDRKPGGQRAGCGDLLAKRRQLLFERKTDLEGVCTLDRRQHGRKLLTDAAHQPRLLWQRQAGLREGPQL